MIKKHTIYKIKGNSEYFKNKYATSNPTIVIEDRDINIFGNSWAFMQGNPACLLYAMRSATENLPPVDVYYGHIDGMGELVHESELEEVLHTHKLIKDGNGAKCSVCNKRFSWWCPKSPDHACHYRSTKGEIELVDGTVIKRPKSKYSPDPEFESEDNCIFCGMPDERK